MLKKLFIGTFLASALISSFAHAQFKHMEGRDYVVLHDVLDEGKAPKIIEFFWYGCPHCYDLEPFVQDWLKKGKAENVTFERVPAISHSWLVGAQLYYTAQLLNLGDDIDTKIFDAVHKHHNIAVIRNKEKAIEFLVANGADKEKAERTWDSLAVQQKLKRAEQLFDDAHLQGVPSMLVNGQYIISATEPKNYLEVANYLVRKDLQSSAETKRDK